MSFRRLLHTACLAGVLTAFCCHPSCGTDQFQLYFNGSVANTGLLGGAAFDEQGDFWLIGFGGAQQLRRVEFNGSTWQGSTAAVFGELALWYRADDLAAGNANSDWGGRIGGAANALQLNPAPLTIEVDTASGGTETVTYPAGSLAFIADATAVPVDLTGASRPDVAKKLWRYDLRLIFDPTSDEPDYNTARPLAGAPRIGSFGTADWNDVFRPVVSEQDLRNQSGSNASDTFGRQFAWSTDGQTIYAVDSSTAQGGIYRIDPTRRANSATGIERILDDGESNPETNEASIRSEPAVVHTSVFDFSAANPAVGDQIVVEGSFNSGNAGGVNVFVDQGGPTLPPPTTLFTETDFRAFADYFEPSRPRYIAIADDAEGNLYLSEQQTDMLFRYDTQGRFVKIANERELNLFQQQVTGSLGNDNISNLSIRTSTAPGFQATEIVYVDSTINAPIGILAYTPGDFDRDNDVDGDDLSAFAAALGPRNTAADDAHVRFDLNGNKVAFLTTNNAGETIVSQRNNEPVVVDWKDVKVLQQFVDIPNGDTNFDGLLDFADIDAMEANYFTLGGAPDKTWTQGDVASIDPAYPWDAPDASLVNRADLAALANAWVNDLGLAPVTAADADSRGYTGRFRDDLLSAFDVVSSVAVAGDYNGDGAVNAADYTVWRDAFRVAGAGLAADGDRDGAIDIDDYLVWKAAYQASLPNANGDYNGDGLVNAADYTVWRDSLGSTGAGLAADGDRDGVVDADDYAIWKSNYGAFLPRANGDFNFDGVVDAADYTVWRDSLGATGENLPADGDGDRIVTAADYLLWGAGFDGASAGGQAAATPEPASLLLGVAVGVALARPSRRRIGTPRGVA